MSQGQLKCRFGHDNYRRELMENGCHKCVIEEIEERSKIYYCPYCGKQSQKKFENGDEGYIELSCRDCNSQHFRIYEYQDSGPDEEVHELTTDEITEAYRKQYEGY